MKQYNLPYEMYGIPGYAGRRDKDVNLVIQTTVIPLPDTPKNHRNEKINRWNVKGPLDGSNAISNAISNAELQPLNVFNFDNASPICVQSIAM